MTQKFHNLHFPGESEPYRAALNELLAAEVDLRQQLEAVADLRRKLPLGGKLKEDYIFEETTADGMKNTKFSDLFAPGKNSLVIYSFMYGPQDETPCPMCNSLLDGLDGNVPHLLQRTNFVVVAKSPADRLQAWASQRGWRHLRLLSSYKNSYNRDYFAENETESQSPACNVLTKRASWRWRKMQGNGLPVSSCKG